MRRLVYYITLALLAGCGAAAAEQPKDLNPHKELNPPLPTQAPTPLPRPAPPTKAPVKDIGGTRG